MAKKKDFGRMVFSPEPKPYIEKSDGFVKSAIKTAMEAASQIAETAEELESAQAINHETMQHFIDLYTGTVDLGMDESKRYVDFDARSGKAADIIHRVQGMLMAPLKPHYIAPSTKPKDEDLAGAIEKHVEANYKWLRRKYQTPFDTQSLFWQLLVGKSFVQQSWMPNYWDKTNRRRKSNEPDQAYNDRVGAFKAYKGPPFFVESLDPRIVFPIMRPTGPDGWIKKYQVQRFQAEQAFAEAGKPIRIQMQKDGTIDDIIEMRPGLELPEESADFLTSSVTYYEYIDDNVVYYVVGDRVVHKYTHGGSLKIFPAYGLITGFKEWELAAVSILFAVRHELPQFDFMRTLWVNRAYLDVFPQLFAQLAADEDPLRDSEGNPETWKIEPLTIKQIRGKITNAFTESQSGVDYRAVIEMMAGDIDAATISGLARGIGGAQQPGYSINQLSQAMRTIWKPIVDSREIQWSNIFEHYLWCIRHKIKEEVTVFAEVETDKGFRSGEYLSIEPDDIQDFFQIMAELEPDLPIDTQGNMLTWAKMGAEGWATDQEVSREGFGKGNWKERRRQIDKDRARREMMPEAIKDAIKLGKIQLENQVASDMGLTKLNPLFNQSLEAMRQAAGGTPTGGPPGAAPPPPAEPVQAGTVSGDMSATSLGAGGGIAPTTGANPGRTAPGPQM